MARKRRFRFGLPIVFAGRPSVGGIGPGWFAAAAGFGPARQYSLTAYCLIQKARSGFSGAGLILATMKICRRFARRVKIFLRDRSKGRTTLLCMGSFWIFSSRGPSMVQKPCWVGAIAVK
jgi:hypothetical protein